MASQYNEDEQAFDEAWRWLTESAWRLWLDRGIDWSKGGFHEHLQTNSLTCNADFRRLRVVARQTYTFSKAAHFKIPGALEAVQLGIEFLRKAKQSDGGYPWRFNLQNQPVDQTRDLYDHAFVILAYASAANVLGLESFESLKRDAKEVLEYIKINFRHSSGGFQESLPPQLPRRQNPHMHLLEALLASTETFRDKTFLQASQELVELFFSKIYQENDGLIPEFFDDDWGVIRDNGLYVVEPGHFHEWVWLLNWWTELTGKNGIEGYPSCQEVSARMQEFCDTYACDPSSGLVMDALWSDGTVKEPGVRLWPQTERIKSEFRRSVSARPQGLRSVAKFLNLTKGVCPGLWVERGCNALPDHPQAIPASSLYHITAALLDARRFVKSKEVHIQ